MGAPDDVVSLFVVAVSRCVARALIASTGGAELTGAVDDVVALCVVSVVGCVARVLTSLSSSSSSSSITTISILLLRCVVSVARLVSSLKVSVFFLDVFLLELTIERPRSEFADESL